MRGKWILFGGSAILLAMAAGAISVWRRPPVAPVETAPAPQAQTPAGSEIQLMGKIQAAHVLPMAAPVDGILEAWDVDVGQEVVEGQLLGRVRNVGLESARERAQEDLERAQTKVTNLEGQLLAARLEAARADAESSRATAEASRLEKLYQREQMLFKEGATPRLRFEKAEKDYKSAAAEAATSKELATNTNDRLSKLDGDIGAAKAVIEERVAEFEEAKENAESANLIAPADGLVIKLAVEVGGEVERAMRDLVAIATDPALLEVVVEPEPRALELIKPGLPALVVAPDVSSEGMEGTVKEVKGTQVIVEFSSPNPSVKHGMAASVRIKLP